MKAIIDTTTEQILGAAVLRVEGGELMSRNPGDRLRNPPNYLHADWCPP